ncbi:MAG: glycosyltransferase [Thermomicrobiales bacterium]|nr:glycosyltransferase [Thermomicrobiales bacterium]
MYPTISVILATRDRPRFLPLALACYEHQTWPRHDRELLVVDDGEQHPVAEAPIHAAGGRLLRVPPGTPLGAKLNTGIAEARGRFIQKMDDDDWYAPTFLAEMHTTLMASWRDRCRPTLLFLSPFLFLDLAAWEIRRSAPNHLPGATLHFPRSLWDEQPFRPLFGDEDTWFLLDHQRRGATQLTCSARDTFLAVRHATISADRAHTWTHQISGTSLEDYTRTLDRDPRAPDGLLPAWAVAAYQRLRTGTLATPAR